MTEKTEFVPERLREVWEWKDSIYREVQHLPTKEALAEIMRKAGEARKNFPDLKEASPRRKPE